MNIVFISIWKLELISFTDFRNLLKKIQVEKQNFTISFSQKYLIEIGEVRLLSKQIHKNQSKRLVKTFDKKYTVSYLKPFFL